jgi:hypothetical protein
MKVKFTDPLNDKQVLFGAIVEMFNDNSFVVQTDDCSWVIDPNSDYNFRFIPNEESDNKFQKRLNAVADELDALEKKSKKSC